MSVGITEYKEKDYKYLRLLSKKYPNINSASTEIINLQAILNLPKGTEHFLSDIHGEYDAFNHVLKNASGVIKNQITAIFGSTLRESEKKSLATLIYYPEQKIEMMKETDEDIKDWYRITLHRLIKICKVISSKYTRSKVRKALPTEFSYILEELIHEDGTGEDKHMYYSEIIETIIALDQADRFIISISNLIQRLAIDQLHVIGDIYDRGPKAADIMDRLEKYHSVDIQWGNHDLSWMGAAAGCQALICNVVRICARYANLDTIDEDYGINLIPLVTFAAEKYADDPCEKFMPKISEESTVSDKDAMLIAKIHKAISIMQFKAEGQIIRRHPEYKMDHRQLLEAIDLERGTVMVEGREYELNDKNFPTLDINDPYKFSEEEEFVMNRIKSSFVNSEKLQKHIRMLYSNGSLYKKFNTNLMFHGCVPMNDDGTLKKVLVDGEYLSGMEFFDAVDRMVREGYFNKPHSERKRECIDYIWYLWCGENSPLFGKKKMATFERYFIDDKETHHEERCPYYKYRDEEDICKMILENFGMDPESSHIINGHVPVKVSKGESPIKAGGKLFVIDGGFAKAYQKETGIAGYTLIYNSHGLVLVSHEPFESLEKAITEEKDIHSSTVALQYSHDRIRIMDTDVGKELQDSINELMELLDAYYKGIIKEIK